MTADARCLPCVTVYLDDGLGASFAVQAIDVLGDDRLGLAHFLQLGQGDVCGVGPGFENGTCERTNPVVEPLGMDSKGVNRSHEKRVGLAPQTRLWTAKVWDPRGRADPGTSQRREMVCVRDPIGSADQQWICAHGLSFGPFRGRRPL